MHSKAKSSAWHAAGSGRCLLYRQPGNDSINTLLLQHMDSLRNRSLDIVRNNPYAANTVDILICVPSKYLRSLYDKPHILSGAAGQA